MLRLISTRGFAWGLLVILILMTGCLLAATGQLVSVEVNDTASYANMPLNSLKGTLNHQRTPGYPLFLAAVRQLGSDLRPVSLLQYGCFAFAVMVFHAGLLASGTPPWLSPWIAGALLATNNLWLFVSTIATDTLGGACGIASVGFMLLWGSDPRRSVLWGILLAASVLSAWLIRPAALFLVPFVLVLTPLFRLRSRPESGNVLSFLRSLGICSVIGLVPLILYCSLRLAVVGKFSIVAFGGYNLIGISGQFMDEKTLPLISEELRPLAQAAMNRLRSIPLRDFQYVELGPTSYIRMESNSDLFIWSVFTPAAHEVYGDDPVLVNTQLKRLGLELVEKHPRLYVIWLLKASRQCIFKLLGDFVFNPMGGLLTFVGVVFISLHIVTRWIWKSKIIPYRTFENAGLLFVIAAAYAAMSLILVIVVCPPIGRMTDAAGLWIGPCLVAFLGDLLSQSGRWRSLNTPES
ncbi:hypothetical protein SH661x_003935 [Planctomicrobium sp. SH661]|uniref:hypothetical protein n=1 Tax=Planctomicrobium sp. SH661 TaxID=3448124 RepID=UPI003F5C1815